MWAKVVSLAVATGLAIKSVTPPNAIVPLDPRKVRVVNEGIAAALVLRWGWFVAIALYGLAFLAYVLVMWLQETYPHTGPVRPVFLILNEELVCH